jgi:hypothetical protein
MGNSRDLNQLKFVVGAFIRSDEVFKHNVKLLVSSGERQNIVFKIIYLGLDGKMN